MEPPTYSSALNADIQPPTYSDAMNIPSYSQVVNHSESSSATKVAEEHKAQNNQNEFYTNTLRVNFCDEYIKQHKTLNYNYQLIDKFLFKMEIEENGKTIAVGEELTKRRARDVCLKRFITNYKLEKDFENWVKNLT